jgi:hypothetical protein
LGGSGDDRPRSIGLAADGGRVAAGWSRSGDGGMAAWAARLSGGGVLRWRIALGGEADDEARSIELSADGGRSVTGWSRSVDGAAGHGLGRPAGRQALHRWGRL